MASLIQRLTKSLRLSLYSRSKDYAMVNPLSRHVIPGQVNGVVRFLNSTSGEIDTVTMTESCVQRIHELQKETPEDQVMLRLSVEGGGCSGFQYTFKIENSKDEDDHVFEKNGAKLLVDAMSLDFLKGSVVDFSEELIRSSFQVVSNPNSDSSCGCGSSFSAK